MAEDVKKQAAAARTLQKAALVLAKGDPVVASALLTAASTHTAHRIGIPLDEHASALRDIYAACDEARARKAN